MAAKSKYHHMTSRYARLSPEMIDHCVEVVRDGNEAIEGNRIFDAADFIVSARGLLEGEQLLETKGQDLAEGELGTVGDWTLACVADALRQASATLRDRGNTEVADRLRARELTMLRRIAESPWCSPLVSSTTSSARREPKFTVVGENAGLQKLAGDA